MTDEPTTDVSVSPRAAERPRLGLAAQVAAIVGIVACVLLILGAWFGRSWALGQVDELATRAHLALARGSDASLAVGGRLDDIGLRLDEITAAAAEVTASPSASLGDSFPRLTARVSSVVEQYRSFRDSYETFRRGAEDALSLLDSVGRVVPGVSAPEGPRDALGAIDEKVRSVDAAVGGLAAAVGAAGTDRADEIAATVTAQADQARSALATASTFVDDSTRAIADIDARVDRMQDQIGTLTGLGVGAVSLILVYVALLNVALWALGRRWRRVPPG